MILKFILYTVMVDVFINNFSISMLIYIDILQQQLELLFTGHFQLLEKAKF